LVANTDLETGRTPVDELDGALGLEGGNCRVRLLGDDVSAVQQAGGHVLAVAGVALDHLVVGLEARHGDLVDGVGFMRSLSGRNHRRERDQREVDTGIRHQVGLELVQVDVQRAIEAEGRGNRRDDLSDQTVEVFVTRTLNAEVATADVIDGLVVNHEAAVRVLQGGVGSQDGVVGLNDRCGILGSWIDTELQLGLLAIVDRQTLHQEGTKTRAGTTTERVEDQETLETRAVVGNATDLVENLVDHLLANGVVATSVVVRRILLAGDHLLRVEEAAVGTSADLVDHIGLEITVDGTRNILALTCGKGNKVSGDRRPNRKIDVFYTYRSRRRRY